MFRRQNKGRIVAASPWLTFRSLVCAGVAVSLQAASLPPPAQDYATVEYRAKASYLAKLPSSVGWPEPALPLGYAPFLLCVFGEYPIGISLAESASGATIHQRRIETRWIHNAQDLLARQAPFLSRWGQKRYRRVREVVGAQKTLTVGERPDFLAAGGILCLSMEKEILLKISARLLAWASPRVILTEAAKR